MKHLYTILFSFVFISATTAQLYEDYIGGGHSEGITVTTSSNLNNVEGIATLDGSGMDNPFMEASRFLAQSAIGYEESDIEDVMQMGFENWIDDQFTKPTSYMMPAMEEAWQNLKDIYAANAIDTTDLFGPYSAHYHLGMFNLMLENDDLLRHRIAQSLSEVLVVSTNSDLRDWAEALSSYHDLLLDHSFGNYHDLLLEVTKSVSMGYYLSAINNPKTDTMANIRPDENYAREIMQLFSIGLYELNQDGTEKRDVNGNLIPTYDNLDIKEMAKVFTGLGCGALINPDNWPYNPIFGLGMWAIDKTVPMQMFDDDHEPGPKVLLKDVTINIPGDGMAEVEAAVDYLFNHPNVGPFIGKLLIQRLVKSNPSPAYISRVAGVFNDNGSGVRGDMKALIKAILLDDEARSGYYMNDISAGQVRPPFLRIMQYMRSQTHITGTGYHYNFGWSDMEATGHYPLTSPSVFNFYLPNYQPVGEVADNDLVAPEIKIHNTSTSIDYINRVHAYTRWDAPYWNFTYYPGEIRLDSVYTDTDYLEDIADEPEAVINELDKFLTHGQMSHVTREIIRQALDEIYWNWDEGWRYHRARLAIYLIITSPDYAVLK